MKAEGDCKKEEEEEGETGRGHVHLEGKPHKHTQTLVPLYTIYSSPLSDLPP